MTKDTHEWKCTIAGDRQRADLSALVVIHAGGSVEKGPFVSVHRDAHDRDLIAFKAHFHDLNIPDSVMPLLAFPGGYGGLVKSDDGKTSFSCCISRAMLQRCRQGRHERAGQSILQHILHSCTELRSVFAQAKLEGNWLAAGPVRPGFKSPYRDGMFMAGNSAGEAHPIIAEGISMAMQSAWLLTKCLVSEKRMLVRNSDLTAVGRTYAIDWQAAFGLRIRAASLFAQLAMSPGANVMCKPILRHMPQLLTLGAKLSGKSRGLERLSCSQTGVA